MWRKTEQIIIWIVTYTPIVLIMVFRFFTSNNFFMSAERINCIKTINNVFLSKMAIETYFILVLLIFSLLLYKSTIKFFLSDYEERFKLGKDGENYYIRRLKKLNANDYSFFLLTLLTPLVSLDNSSMINLLISLIIILVVIYIYVKTDEISICPLFFFSGRSIYKGVISLGTKEQENEDPSLRKEVIIIIKKENISLNKKVRGGKLVDNVFYLTSLSEEENQ